MANNFTITFSAIDKATNVARKVNASIGAITKPVTDLGNEVKAFGKLSGLSTIGSGLQKVTTAAKGAARSVASIAAPLAAITGFGTIAGVAALAANFGKTAVAAKNAAGVLGMPSQELQRYQGAARLAGLASDDMTSGLKSLGATFEDSVTGRNLEAAGAMNQFGISVHRLKNGSIDTTRALRDIANVIQRMPNAQAQQRFASIFGLEQLLPLLQKGGDGIDALVNKAKAIGYVLTPAQIAAGERYNEQMIQLDMSADKLKVSLGNALAPALERVIGAVGRLVDKYGDVVATKVAEYAERLADWIDRTDWDAVARRVGRFVDEIGGVKTIAIALAAITFSGPIGGLIMMAAGMAKLIRLVPAVVRGLKSIGTASVAAEAASAAAGGAAEAAGAAGAASGGAGAAAAGASAGWLARLMPWLLKGGVALTLMTHSEGLNNGEDAYLAQKRAQEKTGWSGDPVGEKIKAAAEANPVAQSEKPRSGPDALFAELESKYRLPSGLLDSVWSAESQRGKSMLSPAGAEGHFQFMPGTARQYGVKNPYDLRESANGAARMYADLLAQNGGDLTRALAAYNWGQGNLSRKGLENAPAETRGYIRKVMAGMPLAGADSLLARSRAADADAPMSSLYKARDASAVDGDPSARIGGGNGGGQGGAGGPQLVRVDINLRGAPPGTTALARSSSPGVTSTVRIGVAGVGAETV